MAMIEWFDDLAVGMQFKTGEACITAPDIKRFAAEFDPQPSEVAMRGASCPMPNGVSNQCAA